MSSSVPMPFATDGAVGVASCALVARNAYGSRGRLACKPRHWRAIQRKNGWKAAPMLGFVMEH